MKKLRTIFCLLLVVSVLVFTTACKTDSDSPGTSTAPDSDSPETSAVPDGSGASEAASEGQWGYWPGANVPDGIQPGTVLDASYIGQDFTTHLPWTRGSNKTLWQQIYDCLFYAYQGDPADIRGSLIESWEWADDMLSIVMQVREGVTFSNGNPLDAQTIVDSFAISAEMQPSKFDNITSMEATGEFELTFTFEDNYPNFLLAFCDGAYGIVDPKAIEEFGTESNEGAIGTGPYYIESYSAGEILVLKANTNYFLPEMQPHIETVNLHVIPTEETAVAALINGDLNWMKSQSIESAYAIIESGMFKDVIYHPSPVQAYYFNWTQQPLFQNIAVREALVKLVDWQGVCDLVFDGVNVPATSLWPSDTPLYVDNSEYYYCDPEEALQILDEAGIDPKDISFKMLCNPNTVDVVTAIQGQLAQYGITVEPDMVSVSAVRAVMNEGKFEIGNTPTGYGALNPSSGLRGSLSPNATSIMYDFSVYDQELMDSLVNRYLEATTAPSYEEFIEGCRAITETLQENYVFLGGYQSFEFFFHADNVRNIVAQDIGGAPLFCYYFIED